MNNKTLRVGTTEGRFRMVMPDIMAEFQQQHPTLRLEGIIGNAERLREDLVDGKLDLAFSGISPLAPDCIEKELLFEEKLFVVVSDDMLRAQLKEMYPACLDQLRQGADLKLFEGMPFCFSMPNLHCMQILDHLLKEQNITLDRIHTSPHFDLHQELAVRNYAGCFCLSMYLPHLNQINACSENKLHVFPIKGLTDTNPVYILTNKERDLSDGIADFKKLIRKCCAPFT